MTHKKTTLNSVWENSFPALFSKVFLVLVDNDAGNDLLLYRVNSVVCMLPYSGDDTVFVSFDTKNKRKLV